MNRNYTSEQYEGLVRLARRMIPDVAITTDVIVGFPGEDEVEFAQSLAMIRRMEFARVHVFPYSPRPNTVAVELSEQVAIAERKRRARIVRSIGRSLSIAFRRTQLGREAHVLWESAHDATWEGLTDNYIRVSTHSEAMLRNRLRLTRLTAVSDRGMLGDLVL
jgi:threonylcarbamoyladenosine tRNA methylthiotransferase MtaB